MNKKTPYNPPKSTIESEEAIERLRTRKRQRRPSSHKFVLVFFGLYAVACFSALPGINVTSRILAVVLAICAISVISVVGIVSFRLSRFTYFFTSASLLLLLVTTIHWIRHQLQVRIEGDVAAHASSLLNSGLGVVIVVVLIWRYTFGAPSRAYYGFSSEPVTPRLPKSTPPSASETSRSGFKDHLNY